MEKTVLRIGYGLVPLLAGADKFTNLMTRWEKYLSPVAERMLPVRATTFMKVVGVVEMAVGLAVLTKWPRRGAYVASAWLAAITANILTSGEHYDVAARDALLAAGAFALGRMLEKPAQDQLPQPKWQAPVPTEPARTYAH
jgi:uncharacterized membrane protein YphA (DoxX/SURF4 family)